MSRSNNWAVNEPTWAPRPAVTKRVQEVEEEDPDEQSVPEGPPAGTVPYRRGSARARSSASPRGAPGALEDPGHGSSQGYSQGTDTMYSPQKAPRHPTQRGPQHGQPESSVEEDTCSTPVMTAVTGRRLARPASARPQEPQAAPTHTPAAPIPVARPTPASQPQPPTGGFTPAAARPRPPASQPPAAAPGRAGASAASAAGWGAEMLVEDMEDFSISDPTPPFPGGTGVQLRGGAQGYQGVALPPESARQFNTLMWGASGQPPASWKQGLFFSQTPGLRFGLVQLEGGPCGILAGVQAYVLAGLRQQSGSFQLDPSSQEQQAALLSALTDLLWQARIGPVVHVAAAVGEQGGSCASLSYDQLLRSVVLEAAGSKDQLRACLQQRLPCYMDARGWGLVLLLLSLVESHGVQNIRGAMDEPGNTLMGMHGYCTQELVNLLIAGQACSNVFDGNKELEGSVLHGITRRCRVGLLTLFEWYKYVEVGPCLKCPDLPIWVVCSESHFTVLFANDGRSMRNELPFDLHYYDELANQQGPIKLSLSKDPRGGWTARVGDSFGDRGKCEGQNIPPLECVIETRWPGVHVDWNGTEPIL